MSKETFWTQKPTTPEYWTITFSHYSFGVYRLVAGQYHDVTLGGEVYTATSMAINPPSQTRDPEPILTVSFPRAVVGREFDRIKRQIDDAGGLVPTGVNFSRWAEGEVVESFDLWLSDEAGITKQNDAIQVKAVDDNSLRYDVSRIYNIEEYTGLAQI